MSNELCENFAQVCEEYCCLVERYDQLSAKQLFVALRDIFPRLYQQAQHLPLPETDSEVDHSCITHEAWQELYQGLTRWLGKDGLYWEVFDPTKMELGEPLAGSLADDIADVYRDVKIGLVAWREGGEGRRAAAVWHWRFSFETHWSRHITDAMRPINCLASRRFSSDTDS